MFTWMHCPNADIWDNDTFDTIEECIEDAKRSDMHDGDSIYIGECKSAEIGGIYFEDVLEDVEEDMYDKVGEVSEDWDISSTYGSYKNRESIYEKYNDKLRQLVIDYIKEIGETPTFYNIVNIQEVMIGD